QFMVTALDSPLASYLGLKSFLGSLNLKKPPFAAVVFSFLGKRLRSGLTIVNVTSHPYFLSNK
ncbi:hypothetical protein, partial [Plesiomonas shigelloides]|uniref:hypothetical protein n=1 Tax=Plesiomonas shigelloides TaxID=703 RepID=UPI0022472AA9